MDAKARKTVDTIKDNFFMSVTFLDQTKQLEALENLFVEMIGSIFLSLSPNNRETIVQFVKSLDEKIKGVVFEDNEDFQDFLDKMED